MDDTAQNQSNSYVNTYVPPSDTGTPVTQPSTASDVPAETATPASNSSPKLPAMPSMPVVPEEHKTPDTSSWLASTPNATTNTSVAAMPSTSPTSAADTPAVIPTPAPNPSLSSTPRTPATPSPITPPAATSVLPPMTPPPKPTTLPEFTPDSAVADDEAEKPSITPEPATPSPAVEPVNPAKPAAPAAPAQPSPDSKTSENLEDQNIFDLLGVAQASDEEKEAFLDELQQVIWEDFIENDVQLLLTEAEMTELQKIQAQTYENDLEKQEALVVYLEKLIPDLEDIMLEKAMELKRDMVMERIAGMKEYFADKPDKLPEITRAEGLITQNQWRAGAEILNQTAQT